MGNKLGIDLLGKVVVLNPKHFSGNERARRFLCEGGFGCAPYSIGQAIFGKFLADGEQARVEGGSVFKLSDDQSTAIDKQPGK